MPRSDVDQIARHVGDWAARARSMPPSFRGSGDRIPVQGPEGQWIGWALPGEGLALDVDLNRLGITKPIPYVYERSRVQRYLDRVGRAIEREAQWWRGHSLLADCRGAITTYDGIIAARGTKADDVQGYKYSTTVTPLVWHSSFRTTGFPGAGAYASGAGATLNNASAGALSLGLSNPTGGDTKYLLGYGFGSSGGINMAMLVDILVAAGGISTTSTSAQSIGTPALTRYATSAGVLMAFDVTAALGGSAANITVSYTNQAGTAGQTTPAAALTTSALVQTIVPASQMPIMPLAAGDYGVRAVASVTLSASMGGSGTLALFVYKPLTMIPGIATNTYVERDLPTSIEGIGPLPTEAGGALGCLALLMFPTSTSSGNVAVTLKTVAG